jgi:hypothetical protein
MALSARPSHSPMDFFGFGFLAVVVCYLPRICVSPRSYSLLEWSDRKTKLRRISPNKVSRRTPKALFGNPFRTTPQSGAILIFRPLLSKANVRTLPATHLSERLPFRSFNINLAQKFHRARPPMR